MISDPEVAALLELVEKSFPQVETMDPVDVRAAFRAREKAPEQPVEVGMVEDLVVSAAAYADGDDTHEIPVRIYQPPGRGRRRADSDDSGGAEADAADACPVPVVVFAHGGGFVFGTLNSHDDICRRIARGLGAVVVSVDYRLSPEHPHPAGLFDLHAVARWAVDHADTLGVDADRLVFAGDSAGGNLATCATILARDTGGPAVRAQLLMYPMIVPGHHGDSYHRYAQGYANTAAATDWYWEQYLREGAEAVTWPPVAPLSCDLEGLPPVVMISAECDPLHDDSEVYARALAEAGVDCWYRSYPGTFHGFATISALSVAQRAQEEMWDQLRTRL